MEPTVWRWRWHAPHRQFSRTKKVKTSVHSPFLVFRRYVIHNTWSCLHFYPSWRLDKRTGEALPYWDEPQRRPPEGLSERAVFWWVQMVFVCVDCSLVTFVFTKCTLWCLQDVFLLLCTNTRWPHWLYPVSSWSPPKTPTKKHWSLPHPLIQLLNFSNRKQVRFIRIWEIFFIYLFICLDDGTLDLQELAKNRDYYFQWYRFLHGKFLELLSF